MQRAASAALFSGQRRFAVPRDACCGSRGVAASSGSASRWPRARERRGGRGIASPAHLRLNPACTAGFREAFGEDSTCACLRRAPGTYCVAPRCPRRVGAPANQSPTHLAAGAASASEEKTVEVLLEDFGIDGPSRPRRCPRPAPWPGAWLDANKRAGVPSLLVDHDNERRLGDAWFASGPQARGAAGRGHRRGLDGPSMPNPLPKIEGVFS